MIPTLPAAVPRRGGRVSRALGRAALRLMRWRIEGEIPDRPKLVLIAAPHRSNWDFVVGIAAKFALGLDASWLGKHTLFRGPFGWMFRRLGGIPVDRNGSQRTVANVVAEFATHNALVVALAPEGTRRAGAKWKSGFWHIARGAGVPIVPVAFDWGAHTIRVMPLVEATDRDRDMTELQRRFSGVRGRKG